MADTLVKVVVPELGESVAEGSVTRWRKNVGDQVSEGEALVDVTTDKVDVEIPAPSSGTLVRILVQAGSSVNVGAALAEIDSSAVSTQPKPPAAAPARSLAINRAPAAAASPMVRRLASRRGVDLNQVAGTGPGGRITAGDVLAAADGEATVTSAPARAAATAKPMSAATPVAESMAPLTGAHAALVRAMEDSLSIPTATSFRTIDVDVLDARRSQMNVGLKTRASAEKISYTHIIAFAIVRAIRAVPVMTNVFAGTKDGPQRAVKAANLGLAVDTQRKDGSRFLVVPVIRNADALDFAAFRAKYDELVAKARGNTLMPDDLSGATLTLTNPGGIGTVASVPRLMSGQSAIIATGAIGYPAGFTSVDDQSRRGLGVHKVMTVTNTYDHRVVQGAQSGEFLRRVDELLGGADGFYEELFRSLGLDAPVVGPAQPVPGPPFGGPTTPRGDAIRTGAAAMALVVRYRIFGHTAANLDPLGGGGDGDPALDPGSLGLSAQALRAIPAAGLRVYVPGATLGEVLDNLRATYTGTIAYEIEHISNHEQRTWLREQIETGAYRKPLPREQKLALLDRLSSVEAFERYLRRAYLGHKTFSIEGLDAMVPLLDETLALLAQDGAAEVDIGMAHRGRLSVITHIVGWPFEEILREFEQADVDPLLNADVTGDVKYHQGARGRREFSGGRSIDVILEANPSHLESVDSVVEGRTRAVQTDRSANIASQDAKRAVAILIHGDAAFTGQGVVAEVFNMQSLAGYSTGGTLHIIANNQIGFTTTPEDGRSTRYASDLAKGFDVPIVHVNADDVEASINAAQLAVAYRRRFGRDVVIDLIGYRRFGHNETDEPAYTLPLMYERIKAHKTARETYAQKLAAEGTVAESEADARLEAAADAVAQAHARVKAETKAKSPADAAKRVNGAVDQAVETKVPAKVLKPLNEQLVAVPSTFTVHPKLARQIERRRAALDAGGEIDWGTAESLAFAALLADGKAIRLTGQDTERGTFSQRHLAFYDARDGSRYVPLQHIKAARASFEVFNSPLSEYAALGFEYGYSAAAPDALVLWEAQFGDFINGAQIIVDQFVSAGLAKWSQTSRLTLLLPHGYEGAGPEHSSARVERFLQLAAEGNFRVANCSTPAQYFHLLRDQALKPAARPLIVMTPKGLLRLHAAASRLSDLTDGAFAKIIDDPAAADRAAIARIILCSGRIYYDLATAAARAAARDLAIVRVELLEPFPLQDVLRVIASYPNVKRVTWVQEEPKNQGARAFVSRRVRERLLPKGIAYGYIGRPDRASTSEGYPGAHAVEQQRVIAEALAAPAEQK